MKQVLFLVGVFIVGGASALSTPEENAMQVIQSKIDSYKVDLALADLTLKQARDSLK